MTSLMDSFATMLTPDLIEQIGSRLGMDPALVKQGAEIALPLIVTALARSAATSNGAKALTTTIDSADTGLTGNLSGFMSSLSPEDSATAGKQLLGDDSTVVTAKIKETTGLDIAPILGMATPLVLSFFKSSAQRDGLDADRLVRRVQGLARDYADSTSASAVVAHEAFKAADEVRELRGRFSPEQWQTLKNGPLAASALIIHAAPSKGNAYQQELAAIPAAISNAVSSAASTSLIAALFTDGPSDQPISEITEPLNVCRSALGLVSQERSSELNAYHELLLDTAQRTAQAGKEGGFLGIGGEQVSVEEQRAIDQLKQAIGRWA